MTAIEKVNAARDPARLHLRDFLRLLFTDFIELHGDRLVADDRGLIGGLATLEGGAAAPARQRRVMVLGHNKGATTEENMAANFGMANPDGYRKAMRLGKLAEKFHLPVITFVDTPGAYPGREAEERGQAEAIAKSLEFFARLNTPVIVVVTGEGGSGGALAIAVGDRVLMLENAVYSVISPEGCAGILWRDGSKAPEAAEALKITAADLLKLGAIDEIIPENEGDVAENVRKAIWNALDSVSAADGELLDARYAKLRALGNFYK